MKQGKAAGKCLAVITVLFLSTVFYWIMVTISGLENIKDVVKNEWSDELVIVDADTIIRKEIEYLCGERKIIFEGPAQSDFIGLEAGDIYEMYPEQEGWVVGYDKEGVLILVQRVNEFCPFHQKFRHLGVYNGFLAVYQGPLGNNEILLKVEKKIPLSSFNQETREKLKKAMDFSIQEAAVQVELRKQFEFTNEVYLNAALENFDELFTETYYESV